MDLGSTRAKFLREGRYRRDIIVNQIPRPSPTRTRLRPCRGARATIGIELALWVVVEGFALGVSGSRQRRRPNVGTRVVVRGSGRRRRWTYVGLGLAHAERGCGLLMLRVALAFPPASFSSCSVGGAAWSMACLRLAEPGLSPASDFGHFAFPGGLSRPESIRTSSSGSCS